MTTALILLDGTHSERFTSFSAGLLFAVFIVFWLAIAAVFIRAVWKAFKQVTGRKQAETPHEADTSIVFGKYLHRHPSGATEWFPAKMVDGDVYYLANGNWHGVMHTHYERFEADK
jgi:hypothetical protein